MSQAISFFRPFKPFYGAGSKWGTKPKSRNWPKGKRLPFWVVVAALGFLAGPETFARQSVESAKTINTKSEFAQSPGLTSKLIEDGWLSLFDGETLFGWTPVTPANWLVKDGEIHVDAGMPGLLRTTSQFDDFELRLEFKSDRQTNSGIFLRTSPRPKNLNSDCYELNIVDRSKHKFPTGSLVSRIATDIDFPDGWHSLRVIADGPEIKVWIDDKQTVDYKSDKPLGRGYIGLQFKSGPSAFRKICLKPLNVSQLKLTKDLSGWDTTRQMNSTFSITDQNELWIQNGSGQLETTETFADFIFSMHCQTNAAGLNSGIFFRCIPGELMNGYESQIQNQFLENDRTRPVDCGTGGIFRRTTARVVNANDQQWFTKTIICTGPHISVWVNGYQVTDWTDERKPHNNPRKGLRLEPGTIMLQGHDPTTDILMKNFRVRELQPRVN